MGRKVSLHLHPSLTKVISLLRVTHSGKNDFLVRGNAQRPLAKGQPRPHARTARRCSCGAESCSD